MATNGDTACKSPYGTGVSKSEIRASEFFTKCQPDAPKHARKVDSSGKIRLTSTIYQRRAGKIKGINVHYYELGTAYIFLDRRQSYWYQKFNFYANSLTVSPVPINTSKIFFIPRSPKGAVQRPSDSLSCSRIFCLNL